MGLTGIIIGIVLLLIVFTVFTDAVTGGLAKISEAKERQDRVIIPVAGEELCDLNLTVYGALDVGATILDTNRIYLNAKSPVNFLGNIFHPEVAQWQWKNCFINGNEGLLDLIPTFHDENLNELAIVITPISTKMTLELTRVSDGGLIQKSPEFTVTAPSGSPLPYTFTKTYKFDNIPHSSYGLSICSSSERINDLQFGECYTKDITKTSQFITP